MYDLMAYGEAYDRQTLESVTPVTTRAVLVARVLLPALAIAACALLDQIPQALGWFASESSLGEEQLYIANTAATML